MLLTRRRTLASLASLGVLTQYGPVRAAKPFDPSPSLVAAAQKEGEMRRIGGSRGWGSKNAEDLYQVATRLAGFEPVETAPALAPTESRSEAGAATGGVKGKRPSKKDKLRAAALLAADTHAKTDSDDSDNKADTND